MCSHQNQETPKINCGCLGIIFLVITIWIFFSWVIKSCSAGDPVTGAVQVVKDYKDVADSIWNE